MNTRSFSIIFVCLLVIAVVVLGVAKFNEKSVELLGSPSPSPTFNESATSIAPVQGQSLQQLSGVSDPSGLLNRSPAASVGIKPYKQFPGVFAPEILKNKAAVINTKNGRLVILLYPEASKAASNFISLANDRFYDGLTFHRVESALIQGGDPRGDSTGGPGYTFEDEPVLGSYTRGTVAMANAGPNTNGSQFFILKVDYPLQPKYTIFGKVLQGLDVLDKIQKGDVMDSVQIVSVK